MSAFVVDKGTIDNIVAVTRNSRRGAHTGNGTLDEIGRTLWWENVLSLAYRYPRDKDGGRPGPHGFRDQDATNYCFPAGHEVSPAQAVKSIHCYEYQSCEHPGWEKSEAKQICEAAVHYLCTQIPGYEQAQWG